MRPAPDWLIPEPYADDELGVLRSGKEAQIDVIERSSADDPTRTCLLARKRYLPRAVAAKGMLEAMGVQKASTFTNDVQYREGRQFRKSRDRRAVERMSTYGKHLLQDRWTGHEHDVMSKLYDAGVSVPYPVEFGEDVFVLEYVGDRIRAAPRLAEARLRRPELEEAWAQLVEGLQDIVATGYAHADLSAYNLLWWEEQLVFIDFPQAVDIAENPQGLDFLHRDVVNVATWFGRRGVERDPEVLFAELLTYAYG